MQTRVPGGYAVVTLQQLSNLCALKMAKQISFAALRVWLAAVEQRAKRCTAKGSVRFTLAELARLSGGVGDRSLRLSLRDLERAGILLWSETRIDFPTPDIEEGSALAAQLGTAGRRPVPLPRRLIRLLAKHSKPAEVIAAIAHLIRCLFKQGAKLNMQGFVRAEWVAELFDVSVRAVYATRAWLLRLGVLEQVSVHQLVMNKHGALFKVRVEGLTPAPKPDRESAGLLKSSTRSSTYKNQIKIKDKPALRPGSGFLSRVPKNPTLTAIVPEDLKRLSRLEKLYREAVAAHWLSESEQDARNFIAAAVRATCVQGNPARIFVALVKKRLWHHVTQAEENRALEAFARHERRTGRRFGEEPSAANRAEHPVRQLLERLLQPKELKAGEDSLSRVLASSVHQARADENAVG